MPQLSSNQDVDSSSVSVADTTDDVPTRYHCSVVTASSATEATSMTITRGPVPRGCTVQGASQSRPPPLSAARRRFTSSLRSSSSSSSALFRDCAGPPAHAARHLHTAQCSGQHLESAR